MIEIRCLNDIKKLENEKFVPDELIKMLAKDLQVIKDFSDEDKEYTLEEFNTDYTDSGYIAVLDGTESKNDLEETLGLTGGLEEIISEAAESYSYDGTKWTRIVVIYNDSYGMILWVKNCNSFDDYEVINKNDNDCKYEPF